MSVHMSVIYADNISNFGLSVFFLTDEKVGRVLMFGFDFFAIRKNGSGCRKIY